MLFVYQFVHDLRRCKPGFGVYLIPFYTHVLSMFACFGRTRGTHFRGTVASVVCRFDSCLIGLRACNRAMTVDGWKVLQNMSATKDKKHLVGAGLTFWTPVATVILECLLSMFVDSLLEFSKWSKGAQSPKSQFRSAEDGMAKSSFSWDFVQEVPFVSRNSKVGCEALDWAVLPGRDEGKRLHAARWHVGMAQFSSLGDEGRNWESTGSSDAQTKA